MLLSPPPEAFCFCRPRSCEMFCCGGELLKSQNAWAPGRANVELSAQINKPHQLCCWCITAIYCEGWSQKKILAPLLTMCRTGKDGLDIWSALVRGREEGRRKKKRRRDGWSGVFSIRPDLSLSGCVIQICALGGVAVNLLSRGLLIMFLSLFSVFSHNMTSVGHAQCVLQSPPSRCITP